VRRFRPDPAPGEVLERVLGAAYAAPSVGHSQPWRFPDADLWSCAAAIQNLWLAARAEGLGVGWVTLFRPEDLAALLGLPDGVVTLGWLCLGWPAGPGPGTRRVVAPAPGARRRAHRQVVGARDEADRLLTVRGSMGVLDRAVDRAVALAGARPPEGCSSWPPRIIRSRCTSSPCSSSVTRDVLDAAVHATTLGAVAARSVGVEPRIVDRAWPGHPFPGSRRCVNQDPAATSPAGG
jgi:nicotinate-nucleotide--dimethylbenzimidazole phosphoribosyltransferase